MLNILFHPLFSDRCFFFSSRRRHTRCLSDWSSDVCSSDLTTTLLANLRAKAIECLAQVRIPDPERRYAAYPFELSGGQCQRVMIALALACNPQLQIGRASCRERVWISVVAGSVKKRQEENM